MRSMRSSSTCPARGRRWISSPPSSASQRCACCWPPSGPSSRPWAAAMSAPTWARCWSAWSCGPPNPGTPPGRRKRSPTSASTPRAPPATSSGGTRTPARSPGGAGRSCSASPPGIPPQIGQTLLGLLEAPGGTTASAAGLAIGKSKTVALEYLSLLRDRGIATKTGGGRATRWYRTAPAPPATAPEEPLPPSAYVTVEALADMVHDGLVDVDDDTRAVLEQAREIRDQQRDRKSTRLNSN